MKSKMDRAFCESLINHTLDGWAYCQMLFDAQGNPVDFIYRVVNKNFEKLTGLKDAEGKKVTELIPGIRASNPELFEIYGRVSLGGKPEKFVTYVKPLSIWFSVSVYSMKNKFFVAIFQDITDQKMIEKNFNNATIAARNVLEDLQIEKKRLAEASAKDEAILSSIGDGLIAVDSNGKIIIMNIVAEQLLGWGIHEAIGKSYNDIFLLEDEKGIVVPLEEQSLAKALEKSTSADSSIVYLVSKSNKKFPVAITASSIILNHKIIGAVEVFRDIAKEQAVDKAKTEFVSLVSHQLRTPLSTVSWYTEMLLTGDAGTLNDEQKKYADEVYKGNKRMVDLVNTLLHASRLELGTFVVEPEPKDVVALARSAIDEQRPQMKEKKLTLNETYTDRLPLLNADPESLQMVFQNLLSNAVKYTPNNGTISFNLRLVKRGESVNGKTANEDRVMIVVSDTGYGIPKTSRTRYLQNCLEPIMCARKIARARA